ncbi:hypothetical protein VD0002_g4246 [Verticillium dahliae]|uniref:PD-(D/E)XK nuclease-like domain-containing protein n=2 Tax=Verticillium dahliae TaxID=27337 RepID=G2WYF3_VERDV|nr:uncharacterized protein VDAG_02635 [Verticillium dahliae VdLs.17]KAF3351106.1 hypothetical protein VdG2_00613 [Verticillium dahliae VDG2]KAH6707086.1 hypothetical protein EV126DRAFT_333127 [Verticillium dahliae]EGY21111.1 hypothetical protein VDAG_02635 [Verticillium dahliae VdLs.17]PNH31589.1 hypothetical protein BJF96_g5261 [Verticillium dahliae]PNH45001.1 hypothetical protein VD0004_g2775 [Verticillium dahliae]
MSAFVCCPDDRLDSLVNTWLESLPCNIEEPSPADAQTAPPLFLERTTKRRRLLTPPKSADIAPSSPLKRLHHDNGSDTASTSSDGHIFDNSLEATPRASLPQRIPALSEASSQVSGSSAGSRSPTKRRRRTNGNPHRTRHFDMSVNVPSSLRETWKQIREYSKGVGVIDGLEKENIHEAKKKYPDMEEIKHSLYFDDAPVGSTGGSQRRAFGPTPTTHQVAEMVARAKMCRDYEFDEGAWNTSLHHRVINLAAPEFYQADGQLVYMVPCTSASILPDLVQTSSSRKVDFCLCIEPKGAAAKAIDKLVPTETPSINHTEYSALRTHPIGLSIETKLQGEGLSIAEAQLLTWHANQWRMLDLLTAGTVSRLPPIDFLPGIIVQGNDWLFVASTRDGDCVTLWSNQMIGSTSEPLGVYQIVCVLQFLMSWIEGTYWPWFQRAVLCIEPEVTV